MTRNTYWGGLTSLVQLDDLLHHVIEVTYWAAQGMQDPRDALTLRREAWGLSMAVTGGNRSIKEYADSVVRLAQDQRISARDFAIAWNMRQLVKKFEYGCEMSDEEAKQDFLRRNEELAKTSPLPLELRLCMRRLLAKALPEPSPEGDGRWLSEGRFGPGATFEHASTYLEKLEAAHTFAHDKGFPIWDDRAIEVCPSVARLQAVPKDLNRKRTITVEPLVRAWAQQAVRTTILRSVHLGALRGTIMDQTLRDRNRTEGGWDLWGRGLKRSEPRQKVRCRLGARTGRLATLDLSNASDTMRYDDVMSVFPAWLTPLLDETRSSYVLVGREPHELHMYAGMGNATTFAVETLFFWSLFTAVANIVHGRFCSALGRLDPDVRCGDVTVYGDDIVCRTKDLAANPWAISYVKQTSVVINGDKSGTSIGPGFREACGEVSYLNVSLSETTRLYGADGSKRGAARYCDFASRMLANPIPALQLLGYALITWSHAPDAPLCRLEEPDSAVVAYNEPEVQNLWSMLLRLCPWESVHRPRTRWNPRLQRFEVNLWSVCAYERESTLPSVDPNGNISWFDYQLSLLSSRTQCVETEQPVEGRRLRYPVPHHTKVRRRWVPGVCDPGFTMS